MEVHEITLAAVAIAQTADLDAKIFFASAKDEKLAGEVRVGVYAV